MVSCVGAICKMLHLIQLKNLVLSVFFKANRKTPDKQKVMFEQKNRKKI